MMFKPKERSNYHWLSLLTILIQLLASGVLLYFMYRLNIIPLKYMVIAVVILYFLNLVFALLLRGKETGVRKVSRVVSLVVSISLVFISFQYLSQGVAFLNAITNKNVETHVVSVIVLADNPAETIKDMSGKTIGESAVGEQEYLSQAEADINPRLGTPISLSMYSDYEKLVNALYDGTVDGILLNDSHLAFVELIDSGFESKTKVIYQYEKSEITNVDVSDKKVTKEAFSIYLSGIDTFGPVSQVSRSDVNLLITVNPVTKQILMVSIPRDYYVTLASKKAKDKLTHSGIYGINETITSVEQLIGIEIDYYARVNFTSVTSVVDALGGVTVTSPYDTFVTRYGNYTINPGENNLNGDQALGFVRERYSLPNGDGDRILNQQRLMQALINKALSPKIITNYSSILSSVADTIELSMGMDDLTALIQMQLNDNAEWTFLSYALDGQGTTSSNTFSMPGYNLYVMEPDYATVTQAAEYIRAIESGQIITIPPKQ